MLLTIPMAHSLNTQLHLGYGEAILSQHPSSSEDVQLFVDTYPEGIVLLTPEYDNTGKTVDFVYSYINKTAERMLKRSKSQMIGHRLLEIFPGTDADGIFSMYGEVLRSGKTNTIRFHYHHEGFDTWFRQKVEKFENGILIHTMDLGNENEPMKATVISF